MNIQKIKIEKLIPALYNPRKNLQKNDKEYQKIEQSIREFGYVDPIIVNKDMTIIGGHQRYKVLADIGYKEIDCVIVDLPKNKEKALNIALNKISGEWDMSLLSDLLSDLMEDDFNIEITGFDFEEIEEMTKKNSITDIDELLNEIDMSKVIEKPIWATIRTRLENKEILEQALGILEKNGIRVERSYER